MPHIDLYEAYYFIVFCVGQHQLAKRQKLYFNMPHIGLYEEYKLYCFLCRSTSDS